MRAARARARVMSREKIEAPSAKSAECDVIERALLRRESVSIGSCGMPRAASRSAEIIRDRLARR